MEIFDAHTHFCSREFYEFQTLSAPDGRESILLKQASRDEPGERFAAVAAHRDRFLAGMAECGVKRAVTYASIPEETEAVGQATLGSAGKLVPYAMVNPLVPDVLAKLGRLHESYRYRGITLCPAMHRYAIDGDEAGRALDFARTHGMIVLIHCEPVQRRVRELFGLDVDHPARGGFATDGGQPANLIPLARARPDLRFVVSHAGADFFDDFLEVGSACPNVYIDTAGVIRRDAPESGSLSTTARLKEMKRAFGVGRILYGSGSAGFPEGYRQNMLNAQIDALNRARFSTSERAAVLGGNLSRLLTSPLGCAP